MHSCLKSYFGKVFENALEKIYQTVFGDEQRIGSVFVGFDSTRLISGCTSVLPDFSCVIGNVFYRKQAPRTVILFLLLLLLLFKCLNERIPVIIGEVAISQSVIQLAERRAMYQKLFPYLEYYMEVKHFSDLEKNVEFFTV